MSVAQTDCESGPVVAGRRRWDEPCPDRGWFFIGGLCYGNYLDYGSLHYRSPHEYCRFKCDCRRSQPGNVHACRYRRVPIGNKLDQFSQTVAHESRYFETIADARKWIEDYN